MINKTISGVLLCISCTGCFVLTGDRAYKPLAPPEMIKVHRNSDRLKYSQMIHSPDFDAEVGVENGPIRWEAPFLFYVLPIPATFHHLTAQRLQVDLELTPKSEQVAFAPRQMFFLGTNHLRILPASL